ncbi:unnamed protein product [Anisakis simplex]|uniref:Uncharacterized protein n=1 Tax=Anisakis simplex TaxID=6269 RepID=A0A0M3J7L1_ANISI|nr:unnamed protein product [Anisakis simplex]
MKISRGLRIVKARWNCTRQCTVRVQCVSQRRCAFSTLIRSARYQRLNRLSPKINTCKPMTQTSSTKQRTVMTQLSKRKVITRDVAMQFDRMLYYKDIERIINHVIMRIFSSKRFAAALNGKAQKSNNQAPPLGANRLNRTGTRNRYCTLVNNRNNQDSLNKLSSYNRGFNVISRQQLLRTLDRIIDQKQQIILNERTCASKSLPLSRIRTNLRHSENAIESKRKDQCKNG